jgi:inosine-uridine nucleoside N-ribohydrolase
MHGRHQLDGSWQLMSKIIIDTDPGRDDAAAILLALASPELEVLGIVAVAGNVPRHYTERNARRIVDLSGRSDVPVHAGCERPMTRDLVTSEHVHGKTGLDGYELPEPSSQLEGRHGVEFIIEAIMSAEPGTVTLCQLGPLTDTGTALVEEPRIASRIREIVLMGGAFWEIGNVTPAAEYNMYVDPEAADIVLKSGVAITIAPLDVTYLVLADGERLARFARLGNKAGPAIAGLLDFSRNLTPLRSGAVGAPLYDPCVIAYVLQPELFKGRMINVSIETTSPLTRGATIADWWRTTDRPRNANVLYDVNVEGFFTLLMERFARLP